MNNLFDLSGKRALITGSSQGIGYSLAKGLSDAGAEVILNGRNTDNLQKAADQLKEIGISTHQMAFDVTEHEKVANAINDFEARTTRRFFCC